MCYGELSGNRTTPRLRHKIFNGPIFAIVTPFDKRGDVCLEALKDYLGFLGRVGARELIVNGTTGEFASMSMEERKAVLECCRRHFAGRLIANISACSVKECLSLLQHAGQGNADAALLLAPYYYSDATFEGLVAFFRSVTERSSIPVFLYNFPKHTNIDITTGLTAALLKTKLPIAGIKDSGGKLASALETKTEFPGLQVFVGSDALASKVLDAALDGSVSGASNPAPECLLNLVDSYKGGMPEKVLVWQNILDEWRSFRKQLGVPEISAIKAGLTARIPDFPTFVRPPFSQPSEAVVNTIRDYVIEVVLPAVHGSQTD